MQAMNPAPVISDADRPDTGAESRETEAPQRDAPKEHPQADAPNVTFAQVAGAIKDAKDQDALDEAATLIAAVANSRQRSELQNLYDERRQELQ